jgi:hypothetical protein
MEPSQFPKHDYVQDDFVRPFTPSQVEQSPAAPTHGAASAGERKHSVVETFNIAATVVNDSKLVQAFATAFNMVEPVEFYKIRANAKARAPATVRKFASVIFVLAAIGMFIYIVVTTLYASTTETDVFRTLTTDTLSQWETCSPITTLGNTYTPLPMTFVDDCYKRVRYNVYNTWFPNVQTCLDTLLPSEPLFCSPINDLSDGSGGWLRPKMALMDLYLTNISQGFNSYSCDGQYIVNNTVQYPRTLISQCERNFIQLDFDYSMLLDSPTSTPWLDDCHTYLPQLCESIYASSNPYKCTRKHYASIIDALSNGYGVSSLLLAMTIVAVSSSFSVIFTSAIGKMEEIEL